MADGARTAICIPTFRRPVGLARALRAIDDMDFAGTSPRVFVIDNDPDGGANQVVEALERELQVPLEYHHQPNRGIVWARNTALEAALAWQPEWIAWMDDDEWPDPLWLRHVLDTQRTTGADVVMGPAEQLFESGARAWLAKSGLFGGERFATGASYPYFHTRTSGVLIRASVVPPEHFDLRLNLTGGEDRLFFTRLHRAGAAFAWDDRAVMRELVPRTRVSVAWLIRRWYRTGVTRSLVLLYLDHPGPLRRARRVAGGLLMAAQGLLQTAFALPGGRVRTLRALRRALLGIGASVGALGIPFNEYRRTHGS